MMKILEANGARIPALGLGTWALRDMACRDIVAQALISGYDHIDTAAMYENEKAVGDGLRASGRDRDSVFITTKVWPTEIRDGAFQQSIDASLSKLGIDQVDLLLIHWPPKDDSVTEWARLLNDAAERGLAKHIGVANFTVALLDRMVEASDRPLVANQVENHPYFDQSKLGAACARHGIALIGYCPLYKAGDLFVKPVIVETAKRHNKTPAQIVLRWHLQHDLAGAIPKTGTVSRLAENLAVFDFELSTDEVARISALAGNGQRLCDFELAPDWDPA